MTQNQIAYRNMLINQENAISNRKQAESSMISANAAKSQAASRKSENAWSVGTSIFSTLGALALGLLLL